MSPLTAILLMAYGSPNSLEDIPAYLADVRRGRPTPPELITEIRARYAAIGGKSPLLEITQSQAVALEQDLNHWDNVGYRVFVGMRHWTPTIREAAASIKMAGISRIIALCMTPFSSRMTTGAYLERLEAALEEFFSSARPEVIPIGAWFDHPDYIQALANKVNQGLDLFEPDLRAQVRVIFTAHSLPAALASQGDPYPEQFHKLAVGVAAAAGLSPAQWITGYQSAGASADRWLGPSLEEMISQAAHEGVRDLLVAPIGFLSDHVEILFDIDIQARKLAQQQSLRLERIPSLNDDPHFIHALSQIILKEAQRAED